jgi:hypothetical protein
MEDDRYGDVCHSTISGILAVAGLPSAIDVCNVPIVSADAANVLVVDSCCCCWRP